MSGERRGEWHEWPFEPLHVLRALSARDVEFTLVGGLAAVLQGSPLPTYDIDIAPAPMAGNDERLQAALADLDAVVLTVVDDVPRALADRTDLTFWTPFGHLDLHHVPAGFDTYAALRRHAVAIELEPGLTVLASPLRDVIHSRHAAGDDRQLPALEATLEIASQR